MIYQVFSPQIWHDLHSGSDGLFAAEENATFWLWAYPTLLSWPRKFEWLFSPVVGNTTYPGDLWGVDEAGNLILVETKRGQRSDPFQDFIHFEVERRWETKEFWKKLKQRWTILYKSEQKFWQEYNQDILDRQVDEVSARGVLPYSSKRYVTRQWSKLYFEVIAPRLFKEQVYLENVTRFLEEPHPITYRTTYYIGLVLLRESNSPKLSRKGEKHRIELENLAGPDRVLLSGMTAEDSSARRTVEICWSNY